MKQRAASIADDVWANEMSRLHLYFTRIKNSREKNPAFNPFAERLSKIPGEVKDRILDLYLKRQNLMHLVRFIKWRSVFYPQEYTTE